MKNIPKRITSLILTLSMTLAICPTLFLSAQKVHAAELQGSGTDADPYQISSAEDFETLYNARSAGTYNGKSFLLTNDIDMTGKTLTNASTRTTLLWTCPSGFSGNFDGGGHTIKGLTVPFIGELVAREMYTSYLTPTIKNLTVEGNISYEGNKEIFSGFISQVSNNFVGSKDSTVTIDNCTFRGNFTTTSKHCGGIVGMVGAGSTKEKIIISNCSVYGSLSSAAAVGGVFGSYYYVCLEISNCFFSGTMSATDASSRKLSGIVNINTTDGNVSISDCYYAGTGARYSVWTGGGPRSPYNITNCYGYDSDYALASDYLYALEGVTDIYYLSPTHVENNRNKTIGLTDKEFVVQANFSGFDFEKTWAMSGSLGRPVLRSIPEGDIYPIPDIPENIDASAELDETTYFDFSQYIKSTGDEDLSGQYTYTITDNEDINGEYFDEENFEFVEGKVANLATVNGTTVTFDSRASIGEHTVTVKGTYIGEEAGGILGDSADDIEFTITETVTKTVPAPQPSTDTFPYSAAMRLRYLGLNDNWQWVNENTIPRDNASYEVIYPIEDSLKSYYKYSDISGAVYNAEKGGIVSEVQLFVTASEESPYWITVTVKNRDNERAVEGATVSSTFDYEFPDGTTDADGKVLGELTAGSHIVYAEAENFERDSSPVTVLNNNANAVTVWITPQRVNATLPTLYSEGSPVRSTATVTKLNYDEDPAYAWNNRSAVANYAGGSTQPLPTGKYRVNLSAYGYTGTTIYMKVEYPDVVTYYSDDSFDDSKIIDPEELADIISEATTKLGDAVYTVDFTKHENERTATAVVTLKNVAATMGTFGLSYDPDLFSFNPDNSTDFVLNSAKDIRLAATPETEYGYAGEEVIPEWDSDMGYYVFRWSVGDDLDENGISSKVLDAELTAERIATFTFHLNDGVEWDEVTSDSFGIMPWTETDAAEAYKTWYDEKYADNPEAAGNYLFEEHWRKVDVENSPYSLGVGRIEASKAVVNGIDMGGFFEVAVNNDLGSEDLVSFHDVMTVINMFDTNNTSLRFTVTDAETGDPIEYATVVLYPTDEMLPQTRWTNARGIARFLVDSAAVSAVEYTYTVTLNGYWSVEAEPVTVQPNVANNVEVELVKKIYHVPEVANDDMNIVGDMDLGGERYGYNGRDFHFRAKAKPGYVITTYPTKADVVIGIEGEEGYETTTITLTEADDHMFTLDASFLHQAELTLEKLQDLYEDVGNDFEQPNENGYRSYNIKITFDQFEAREKALQVSGLAGDNGKVSYNESFEYETPVTGLPATTVTVDHEYVVSGIVPGRTGYEQTGTFTFEADDGYMVEKVFINGVQTHDYDNLDKFDYSFGKPTMDGSIAVTFWDGENASTDSIITLVVGDYGAVNVSTSEANDEDGVRETTRTYLNCEWVTFTTVPDTGYQLYSIETQIDDGARVPYDLSGITDLASQEDNSFDFRPEASHNKKIYVTFKNPNAPKTPTIFVKSYVERGSGTITPFGILVYNIYDTVELDLAANDGWDAWGVKVSPFGMWNEGVEYAFPVLNVTNEYVIDSIENDTEVGAIFEEHRYVVKGKVDLSQNMSLTDGPWAATNNTGILSGATVTFVRTADTEGRELDEQTPVWTVTTADRKNAVFSIEIPVGTWTVTVSKQGYVNYIITNYVFDANEENAVEGAYDFSAKTIVPFIGSTTDGRSISVNDIAGIRSGLRENINDTAKAKADVDNNGIVDVTDMTFVLKNFGERTTYKPFEAFDSN